jgi:hypothetical protein
MINLLITRSLTSDDAGCHQWKMSKKKEKFSIGAAPFSKGKGLALLA